jgi:hypothetical protein
MQHEMESPLLSPQCAFVVQFHANTEFDRSHITGRVEHVVSGQAMTFQSLEGLLAFLARVLREVHKASPEART